MSDDLFTRAFPNNRVDDEHQAGVSKLGYYAAFAMMGLLADVNSPVKGPVDIPRVAVKYAENLILELEKRAAEKRKIEKETENA